MKKFFCLVALIVLFMDSLSAAAAVPRTARTVCGEIQEIEHSKRLIQFLSYSQPAPMIVVINNRTAFFQDGKTVSFQSLKKGVPMELVYKAPLFGERFARKLRWDTKGELESRVCRRHEREMRDK